MKKNSELSLDPELVREAQSIVALAFRNGPIENVHAGKECPVCAGKAEYSHITEAEMKSINKRAVDKLYALLWVKRYSPDVYPHVLNAGIQYAHGWDLPEKNREEIEGLAHFADFLYTDVVAVKTPKRERKTREKTVESSRKKK